MNIFFSAPFTKEFDFSRRKYKEPVYRQLLENITACLEELGHKVYLAQREEGWGQKLGDSETNAAKDFSYLSEWSDVLLCYPRDCTSVGVCLELGWASALKKPVVLIENMDLKIPDYLKGLENITNVRRIFFQSAEDLFKVLRKEFQ